MREDRNIADFMERVQAHREIVHKVAYVYGRGHADREDLSQEILLQLWKSFDSFGGRSEFSTWMYRVALNTAITFRRRQKPETTEQRQPWVEGTQLAQAEFSGDLEMLYRAIARLSAVEKAIIMQWLDERSYRDIADTVGISVKNVSVRLVRIRERLGKFIREAQP